MVKTFATSLLVLGSLMAASLAHADAVYAKKCKGGYVWDEVAEKCVLETRGSY